MKKKLLPSFKSVKNKKNLDQLNSLVMSDRPEKARTEKIFKIQNNFLEEAISKKDILLHGMFLEKKLIGYVRLPLVLEHTYLIEPILVSPFFRGKGFGKLFLNEVCRLVSNKKKFTILSNVEKDNPASIKLHKSCGFVFNPNPIQVGLDDVKEHLQMIKRFK
ncbi:MAG: GNAT family N-acetyltransferase [Alphaproteobacteria bacterium]|nr:MAG: hypothetical protein B6I23_00450 [Rickettsiaceae bacterium 4572_127]